jgi:hypothetical protein
MSANASPNPQPVYVYGVVSAETTLEVADPGVAGERIELVAHDGVAAVISAFPAADPRVRRRDLDAHLRTIERIFEQTTVAPCAFGTVIASRRDVQERFLGPRGPELRRLLAKLEGHVQMNVKAEYDEDAVLREVASQDRDVAAARERAKALGAAAYYENIRLGELVSAAVADRRARDGERIGARLSPLAADSAADPADGDELLVFKASFLVGRERLADFDAALDELAADEGGRIRFDAIGPLPPTAFARVEEVAAWA